MSKVHVELDVEKIVDKYFDSQNNPDQIKLKRTQSRYFLVIALVAFFTIGALSLFGKLDLPVTATLLGGLIGYIFGRDARNK